MAKSPFYGKEFVLTGAAGEKLLSYEIAALANGQYAVVGGYYQDLVVNIFNADGTLAKSQLTIATSDSWYHPDEKVLGLADGGFVVTWATHADGQFDQQLRIFNADGTARTGIRHLNAPSDVNDMDVSLTQLGKGFLASWRTRSDDATDEWSLGISGRVFDRLGRPKDDAEWLNVARDGYQEEPESATLTDGSAVVVYRDWPSAPPAGNQMDLRLTILNKNGSVLVPDFVSELPGAQWSPEVTALADGRFAVISHSGLSTGGNALYAQIFELDRSGAGVKVLASGPPIHIVGDTDSSEAVPRIVGTAGGGFFAAWLNVTDPQLGGVPACDVMGQFYSADGTPAGDVLKIGGGVFSPDLDLNIAENKHGGIMVTWHEYEVTSDGGLGDYHYYGRIIKAPIEAPTIDDFLRGKPGDDTLSGGAGDDTIYGGAGDDILKGGDDDDIIKGDAGADKLYGGDGADIFVFETNDSGITKSKADTIYDFTKTDTMDFSGWDANTKKDGNQDFDFIGVEAFSKHVGELRFVKEKGETWIEGNTDSDAKADFIIRFDDSLQLKPGFFEL